MNIVYVECLSFYSLMAIIWSRINYSHIFYFNTSSGAEIFLNFFVRIGLLKVKPQPADFCYADIKDEKGESQFIRITEDIKDLCLEISDKEFANNSFLRWFSQHFDDKKILLFFEKALMERINDTVVFINGAKWHSENKVNSGSKSVVFFLERNIWSSYLTHYALKLNMKSIEYLTIGDSFYFNNFFKGRTFALQKIKSRINALITKKSKKNTNNKDNQLSQTIDKTIPLVAACYTGRMVTFDLKKRSDFFWLLKSGVLREQILVYFNRADIPATQQMIDTIKDNGLRVLALTKKATNSHNVPIWSTKKKYKELKIFFIKYIFKSYLFAALKFKFIPLFYLVNICFFAVKYAYWYDFFNSNNIKIYINPVDIFMSNIPALAALEENHGVSISYQWSNLSFSSVLLSSCADVLFPFGPTYKWVWEENRSRIGNLVYCGYITDYSFKEVKKDAITLREQLKIKGVQFVICYFDENSSDDRMSGITNERSAEIYKYFIKKMLEDKTLGLIFKPGYPKTLYKRISSISDLIEKAKASGRCIFMDKGSYVTEQYPTEAAQVADLCVGLLLSGTVALESYLSGTPTVFLDLEKLYSNPVYQWGRGKVVFDSLDSLFSAIRRYRENPASVPGFGDLSNWVKDRDPFKDGNASLRIGQYINWLFEKFKEGGTREDAIKYANQRYAEAWGKENVVRIRDYGVENSSGLRGKN